MEPFYHGVYCGVLAVFILPSVSSPDTGMVQKVVVLPTNHSLGEDLILEELEVFKVCCFAREQILKPYTLQRNSI